jgi:hypothetical protein
MSKTERAFDRLLRALELMGYSADTAIELISKDVNKAKAEVDDYYRWLEERIELHYEK